MDVVHMYISPMESRDQTPHGARISLILLWLNQTYDLVKDTVYDLYAPMQ